MTHYIVTLAATATTRVWVEAENAADARTAALGDSGESMMPWAPETKPQVRKVEKA